MSLLDTIRNCTAKTLIKVGIGLLTVYAPVFATAQEYTIEQFLNTKSYGGGAFSYDEKRILFSCDESGVLNVYSIDITGDNKKQLTHSESQAIHLLTTFPHDDRFLYAADGLGDEIDHIFLWDNNESRDLTPYSNAKSQFEGWSRDKKSFFFSSNAIDPKYMDLYEMEIDSFTPKLIYRNEQGLHFGCISPDKRYLAFSKMLSKNSCDLYLYDTTTGALSLLFPHQEEIDYLPVLFSNDSKTLYFATDKDSEFTHIRLLDIPSGQVKAVEKHHWDVSSFKLSDSGRYRIASVNDDGRTKLHIYDQHNDTPIELPEISEDEITDISISKSEKMMRFFAGGSRTPSNLYVYNFEDKTSRKLAHSLSPDINPDDLVDGKVIRFASYDGMEIPAIYYKPHNIPKGKKIPAIIWVHGGPGGQSRATYSYLLQFIVNHGYAVLAINNRGSSGYGKTFYQAADRKHGEADLDDCVWSKKFLVATGDIDENKVGILGGSYGGYMTLAALAFRPEEMAVGVDIFGVANWIHTLKAIPAWWEIEREALYTKIGDPVIDAEYLQSISPLFHAHKIVKPLLVLQGANDPRVLKEESDQIIEAVSKNDIPYQYVVFDDEGHGFTKKKNQMTAAVSILEFLDLYLK